MRSVVLGVTLAFVATASADAPKARRVPGALVLVIDRSLTMHGPRLDAMKAAALASVGALGPDDRVAIVAFDSEVEVVVPLQRAANRARIARAIGGLRSEGGTNLYTGLRAAHEILSAAPPATKHVIFMSDGDAPEDGLRELIATMREHGETLSIIGLPVTQVQTAACCRPGAHADRTLLTLLAKGGGRLYIVDDLTSLAKTVVADVKLALE